MASGRTRRGAEHERRVQEEYARLAPRYDERWKAYISASIELTLAGLPAHESYRRILDVGCGTGALLAPLRQRFPAAALVGVDQSRSMLAVARARLPADVALLAARAEALPFRSRSFDLAASTSALHYFRDPRAAVGEMERVVEPGGSVLITDWCADFLTVKLFDIVMRRLGKASFATLGSEAAARLLHDAGFENVRIERRRATAFWGLMIIRASKPGDAPGTVPDASPTRA